MLTSAVNTLAKGLTSSAVEFTFKGNETEARQNLTPTTVLAATIQFGGGKVRGHHEGSRLLVSSKGFLKLFPKYTVEANGYGTFTSRELGYTGNFYHGKFHDQSGNAICTLGTDMKYHGSFQNGHASGHGVLTVFVGGKWYKAFDGEWKLSTPWTGDFFDADGNVGHVIHEGNVLSTIRNDTETSMTERKLELLTELKSLVEKKLSVSDRLSTVDIADLALRGDTSLLQLLRDIRELDAIPNINEISSIRLLDGTVESITPLGIACMHGHSGMVELLLQNSNIDVNYRSPQMGRTPLMIASEFGDVATVRALLNDKRVDVNAKNKYGVTAMSLAADYEIKRLIARRS